MTIERTQILKLYKELLRYSNTLVYTDKSYYLRRIKQKFRDNQALSDTNDIDFCYKQGRSFLERKRLV